MGRRNATEASVVDAANFRIPKPKKEPPSELEVVAKDVARLNIWIARARQDVVNVEKDFRRRVQNERETLSNLINEHRAKSARLEELSQMPQAL
jgi:hypothetical protein